MLQTCHKLHGAIIDTASKHSLTLTVVGGCVQNFISRFFSPQAVLCIPETLQNPFTFDMSKLQSRLFNVNENERNYFLNELHCLKISKRFGGISMIYLTLYKHDT